MSTPMQLPVRVLFKGPSTLVWTSMMGGPRTDMVFPRVMEAELLAGGRAVDSWIAARNGWVTRELFETWEDEISSWSGSLLFDQHHITRIHLRGEKCEGSRRVVCGIGDLHADLRQIAHDGAFPDDFGVAFDIRR